MNDQTLAQGTHFLITTFNDRISELVYANLLTESEADEYKNQNISLLTGTVKDAYNLLLKEMAGLRGKSVNENGLYYYDRGKDYYEYLLKKQTGSSRSVADIKLMLTEQYKADSEALNQIGRAHV